MPANTTTPNLETKLRRLIDNYVTNTKSLIHFRDDFLAQYDNFVAASHNQLLNNATVIDDENDVTFDNIIDDEFKSDEDVEFDKMLANMSERTTPIIMFCSEFLSSSFIQLYIKDNTNDRARYTLLDSRLRLDNRLDIFEILGIASMLKQYSDPNCFDADFDFYIRNNPAYQRCDFNDPMLKTTLKTHLDIDI